MVTDDGLGEAFLRVARRLRRETQLQIAPLGLSPHQSRALRIVATHGPLRPSEVAEHLGIAPRSVTEVVDGLDAAGLVARTADPGDRRATLLTITDLGLSRARQIAGIRAQVSKAFFERLDPAERRALAGVLTRLSAEPPA